MNPERLVKSMAGAFVVLAIYAAGYALYRFGAEVWEGVVWMVEKVWQ